MTQLVAIYLFSFFWQLCDSVTDFNALNHYLIWSLSQKPKHLSNVFVINPYTACFCEEQESDVICTLERYHKKNELELFLFKYTVILRDAKRVCCYELV